MLPLRSYIQEPIKNFLGTERFDLQVIAFYSLKLLYHKLISIKSDKQTILFIVGCQRSGTSLMNRIFTRDFNVSVYRESSKLTNNDKLEKLRLNKVDDLKRKLAVNKAPLIVIKPLVETQNIVDLLDVFPASKALWMYRSYKDVAVSGLNRFGTQTGVRDLKAIINPQPGDWRSEKVSDETLSIVSRYFSEDMNPYDASALFWYVRNQFFFELNLSCNPRVLLCRYEDLVAQPKVVINQIYQHVGIQLTNRKTTQEIHSKSVGKGNQVQLMPSIDSLCNKLLLRLDLAYSEQK